MKQHFGVALFLLLIYGFPVLAGSVKVKKLREELKKTGHVEKITDLYIKIGHEIKGSYPDSALYYFSEAEKLIPEIKKERAKQQTRIKVLLGRTSVETAKGNYVIALEYDSLALAGARILNDRELEAQALMSKGGILYQLSEFDKAQAINREALKLARTASDYKTEGKIITNMATIEFMLGNSHAADSLFQLPLKIAQKAGDEDLSAASYLNIGLMHMYSGNLKTAGEYFRKSIEIYRKTDGKDGLLLGYQNLATVYFQMGEIAQAIDIYTLNYELARELQDKSGLSKACQNLAESYSQIGDYEKALDYFLESMNIRTILNDKKGIASNLSSMGHLHLMQANYKEALEYYRKSLIMNTEIEYAMGIAGGYCDVGSVLMEQNQYDSAQAYYSKAADFYRKNGNVSYLSNVLLNIGKIQLHKSNFSSAGDYIDEAERIITGTENNVGLFDCWQLKAGLHYQKAMALHQSDPVRIKELNTALHHAKKAFNLAKKMGVLTGQNAMAGTLTNILSGMGNAGEALKYALIKQDISDSLSKIQRTDALVNAEIRWKTEKKQEEIDLLNHEKELQRQIISQKSALTRQLILIIVFILVAILLLISISILIMKNKRRKNDYERQKHILEITRLKMQNINNRLSPHLFFNVLNSVSEESGTTGKVREKLGQIASLLRKSLENSERNAIKLSEELEMVNNYIDLQESRIPRPFVFRLTLDENVDTDTLIPAMLLQIPVENAIKHGLMPLEGEKELWVNITQNQDHLLIKIEDNGIGRQLSAGRTTGTGTGLKVLLQTIHLLNDKNRHKIIFKITDRVPNGTGVEIQVPVQLNYEL